jgi:hypothetical protein
MAQIHSYSLQVNEKTSGLSRWAGPKEKRKGLKWPQPQLFEPNGVAVKDKTNYNLYLLHKSPSIGRVLRMQRKALSF